MPLHAPDAPGNAALGKELRVYQVIPSLHTTREYLSPAANNTSESQENLKDGEQRLEICFAHKAY